MKSFDLNSLPDQIQSGNLTRKEAVDIICSFVINNYPVFGLQKYDEDFRADLILKILERGEHILELYQPGNGNFFCFLHTYVKTIINTKRKALYKENLTRKIHMEEYYFDTEEKMAAYQKLKPITVKEKKAPYAPITVPHDELCSTLRKIASGKSDKTLLVLAMKSSFYITDPQVQKVCSYYHIKPVLFYQIIQFLKDSVLKRKRRREILQERRNFAYYHHKRYRKMLASLDADFRNTELKRLRYTTLEHKHRDNWKKLNASFEKGILNLRPTNKIIAEMLGICERQVTYCLNCARKEVEKKEAENSENCLL